MEHPRQRDRQRRRWKWHAPGQQLVQRRAQAVDVGARIDRTHVAARLLGRHVRRRAQRHPGFGDPDLDGGLARQSEVHDDRHPAPVVGVLDQHVAGLEVAMHNTEPVSLVHRQRDVADHRNLVVERHLGRRLVQRLAVDELQRDVRPALDLADLVHPADAGMVDAGLGARLAQEPHCEVGIGAENELDRDRAAEAAVARPVHRTHAALAEQVEQLVAVPADHRPVGGRPDRARQAPRRQRGGDCRRVVRRQGDRQPRGRVAAADRGVRCIDCTPRSRPGDHRARPRWRRPRIRSGRSMEMSRNVYGRAREASDGVAHEYLPPACARQPAYSRIVHLGSWLRRSPGETPHWHEHARRT